MLWKLRYDDGSTFDSTMGPVADAPGLGVETITYSDEQCGRVIISGKDFYVYLDGEWIGTDWFGMVDLVCVRGVERGHVKAGRSMSSEGFRGIRQAAIDDPDFPRKSAWRRDERPEQQPDIGNRD